MKFFMDEFKLGNFYEAIRRFFVFMGSSFQPMMNNLVVVFYGVSSEFSAAAYVKIASMFAISFSVLGRQINYQNAISFAKRDTQTECMHEHDIRAWTTSLILTTGIIIVAIFFGEGLFEVFLGSDYGEVNQFLLYFLCCNLINGLAGSVDNALIYRGGEKILGLVNLITSAVFVIGFIIVWMLRSDTEIMALFLAAYTCNRIAAIGCAKKFNYKAPIVRFIENLSSRT